MKLYRATFNSDNGIETHNFMANSKKEVRPYVQAWKRHNKVKGRTSIKRINIIAD